MIQDEHSSRCLIVINEMILKSIMRLKGGDKNDHH
jgi:hypothetical protein